MIPSPRRVAPGDKLRLGGSDQIPEYVGPDVQLRCQREQPFFQLNGYNETVQGIQTTSGQAAVIENGSTTDSMLTVDTAGHDYTYDGIFRDSGAKLGLTKSGKGTLTIANSLKVVATNNTGPTIINDGKIVLDNLDAFSSPITNNSPEPDALTFNQGIKNMVIGGGVLISGTGGVTKTGPFFLKMTRPARTQAIPGSSTARSSPPTPPRSLGAGKGNVVIDGGATVAGTLDLGGNSVNINGLSGASGTVLGQVINSGRGGGNPHRGQWQRDRGVCGNHPRQRRHRRHRALSKTGTGIQTLLGRNPTAVRPISMVAGLWSPARSPTARA